MMNKRQKQLKELEDLLEKALKEDKPDSEELYIERFWGRINELLDEVEREARVEELRFFVGKTGHNWLLDVGGNSWENIDRYLKRRIKQLKERSSNED